MQKDMVDEGFGDKQSLLSKSEMSEIVRDLQNLGMTSKQIEDTLQEPNPGTDSLVEYEHLVFENIILFYEARRDVEWPDIGYCQHRHTTIEAACRCAKKNGPEWYVAKNVACGFEGQILSDMIELEKRILLMKEQPIEEREELLTDSQLDQALKNNQRIIQKAKSMCGTRSIHV
jgi:DNA-binding transcriptional MerR regulator